MVFLRVLPSENFHTNFGWKSCAPSSSRFYLPYVYKNLSLLFFLFSCLSLSLSLGFISFTLCPFFFPQFLCVPVDCVEANNSENESPKFCCLFRRGVIRKIYGFALLSSVHNSNNTVAGVLDKMERKKTHLDLLLSTILECGSAIFIFLCSSEMFGVSHF